VQPSVILYKDLSVAGSSRRYTEKDMTNVSNIHSVQQTNNCVVKLNKPEEVKEGKKRLVCIAKCKTPTVYDHSYVSCVPKIRDFLNWNKEQDIT
jgi:hypothetical protein